MTNTQLQIDLSRLRDLLEGVNRFGFDPQTRGHNRIGYSQADMDARAWLENQMRSDGLSVWRDSVANLFARFGSSDGPCVMVGSHLDTVAQGGAFDGALGVCVALEVVRSLKDAGLTPRIAIEVVATAEEEGRFGGMLGSQAIAGAVTSDWIDQARDADGVRLVDAMAAHGLNAHDAANAARKPQDFSAFVELHIEQGPVLESVGVPIGVAHSVAGVRNFQVRFEGKSNHSGTTPMHLRADAFAGLAATGAAIRRLIEAHGTHNTRVTIGKADLYPNFIHTVPGQADFVVNLRDPDTAVMDAVESALRDTIKAAAAANGLSAEIVEHSNIAPVKLDLALAQTVHEDADRLGLEALSMPSGAGHDAQTMQALCPSALIFIPSCKGVSHSPDEWSDWADIERGANLLLAVVARLSDVG